MATLLFTALGTALGGPLGGTLGALAGRSLDSAIFGSGNREGPRLKELSVSTSSYGTPLPRHFGRMRVPGSIIWATELVEHRDKAGGGKDKPSVTAYSYTASFAVALASRPISDIGRIWADGSLLRGAGGDLKAAGALRLHSGHGDQAPDPLIAAAEGAGECPAFRGLAYVVFEDLQLGGCPPRSPPAMLGAWPRQPQRAPGGRGRRCRGAAAISIRTWLPAPLSSSPASPEPGACTTGNGARAASS